MIRIANSVDPDETAHHEPSHLDLHFVKVYVLVCRAERVKKDSEHPLAHTIDSRYLDFAYLE